MSANTGGVTTLVCCLRASSLELSARVDAGRPSNNLLKVTANSILLLRISKESI